MASNEIPYSYEPIIEHLEDAADGAHQHGVAIGLKQNTEAAIRADLAALTGTPAGPGNIPPAVEGLAGAWDRLKANKTAMSADLRTANSNGKALLLTCINTLKPVLGNAWNSQWNAVGFTDSSLGIPANPMVKLQKVRAFYAANPAREVASVNGIACTAAACEAAAQAISDAQSASNQSNTDAGLAQAALQTGINAARNRLIGLRNELGQLLADDDPRWLAFGFEMPGNISTPEVPANLVGTPGAAGTAQIFYHWDNARRADSYRIVIKNAAGDELVNELVWASEFMASGLPAGATVSATVTGHNLRHESQPCAPISTVVP